VQSEEAWRQAQDLTTSLLGLKAKLFPAQGGSYQGAIIGATNRHVVQRLTPVSAVAHDREVLDQIPKAGERVRIRYIGEKARIERVPQRIPSL